MPEPTTRAQLIDLVKALRACGRSPRDIYSILLPPELDMVFDTFGALQINAQGDVWASWVEGVEERLWRAGEGLRHERQEMRLGTGTTLRSILEQAVPADNTPAPTPPAPETRRDLGPNMVWVRVLNPQVLQNTFVDGLSKKIAFIKLVRGVTGIGLREAKDFAEGIADLHINDHWLGILQNRISAAPNLQPVQTGIIEDADAIPVSS